jgi:hypothetical protein
VVNNDDWDYGSTSHGSSGKYKYSSTTSVGSYGRCYEKHPALQLPGTDFVIYGGSCSSPAVKDADVYIGFDHSMKLTARAWPWKKGAEFLFEIQDMGVPRHPEEFQKLVKWTKKQVDAGLKVHCGCIGGHGRTGMMLSALVSLYGEKDAISYVRQHYCPKAVESSSQVSFLKEQFGIKKVGGSKSYGGSKTKYNPPALFKDNEAVEPGVVHGIPNRISCIPCKVNIWGTEAN